MTAGHAVTFPPTIRQPKQITARLLPTTARMTDKLRMTRRAVRSSIAVVALCSTAASATGDGALGATFRRLAAAQTSDRVAANDAPGSRDALFGDNAGEPSRSQSPDKLFGDDRGAPNAGPAWHGFVRGELAYTYAEPAHWSKMLVRSQLEAQGALSENVKYKLGARLDYDFVYDATDFYPRDVRRDQRVNLLVRENYLDFGAGDWDFRVGRQHVVWGEMVGLFFADVVSAKDLREFILPDFDILRIPQWTARAEYFKDNFHAEAIWIPVPSYDEIGKPGAEFFPAVIPPPPGFATAFDNEQIPRRSVSNSNYGLRASYLTNGWDLSSFYYRSMDAQPTFYREIVQAPRPAFVYQARHDRIDQFGGTLAKDFGNAVLKAETVYTRGRSYSVFRPDDDDGVVRQNTLDVVGGLDFSLPADTRLNLQLFDRVFFDHDPAIPFKRHEPGFSVLLNYHISDRIDAEVLWITSLVRSDSMLRPRLVWSFDRNWRLLFGVDIFDGPPLGLFGQYSNRDRIYSEIRYSF